MVGLLIAALCIVLNGFFVAAEFAMVKARATQVHSRARRGERRAIAAQHVLARLDRYLSVSQLAITLTSLGLGWVGEPAIARIFDGLAMSALGHELSPGAHVAIDVVALAILTFAHVLFGELVPKLISIQRSEATVLVAAIPLRIVFFAFRPLLWVLELGSRVVLRAMGMKGSGAPGEAQLSEEEIIAILAANAAHSRLGKEKSELLERVMRFSQRAARHCMVPRVDVVSLPIDTTGLTAFDFVRTHQFSRIILTKGRSLDEIAGYLYAKDFFLQPETHRLPTLHAVRRDVLFVPETQSGIDVLRDMQRKHVPVAVVVDEYGGTSGIVTMEDLLEEIVGEIRDEFDEEPQRVVKVASEEGAWDVDGRATMEELRAIGLHIEDEDLGEPVGALVLELLGRLPRAGDRVPLANGATAEVTAISRRRVTRVRVRVPAKPAGEAAG